MKKAYVSGLRDRGAGRTMGVGTPGLLQVTAESKIGAPHEATFV